MKKHDLKELIEFASKGSKRHVDPAVPVVAQFELIRTAMRATCLDLDSDAATLKVVKRAVTWLLLLASTLVRLSFWGHLRFPVEMPWGEVPEPSRSKLSNAIKKELLRLKRSQVTQHDLMHAMDTLDKVTQSLFLQFTFGGLPKGYETDGPAKERYVCSAMLATTRQWLEGIWLPLRAEIPQKGRVSVH